VSVPQQRAQGRMRKDTRAILRVAAPIWLVGMACWLFVALSGGLTKHGPTTPGGWICLMIGLGCVPTGSLFLLLGIGKYFEDRKRVS
jgi:hypothetical protein